MEICHASLTELRVFPSKLVTLHRYNDTGHLPTRSPPRDPALYGRAPVPTR